jgi:hypothetical protein
MSILTRIILLVYAVIAVVIADRLGRKLPAPVIIFLYITGIASFLIVVIGDL